MEAMSQARGYSYVLGVLRSQQNDPFCSACNSFVKTLTAAKENLAKFEVASAEKIRELPREVSRLFSDAKEEIVAMKLPENPAGQKKAGNCKLPEGVCFMKSSLALLQKI